MITKLTARSAVTGFLLPLLLAILFPVGAHAQARRAPVGVSMRFGSSYGISNSDNSIFAQRPEDYRYASGGMGLYSFVRILKADTLEDYVPPFRYIKVDLVFLAVKTGAFDLGNGTPTRLLTLYRELSVALPFTFKVSPGANGYVSVGLNVGYAVRSVATPDQVPAGVVLGSSFKPGILMEAGFMIAQGSCVGLRVAREFSGDFPYNETGFFFGFCAATQKKRK
jgi:hypothetical protein